MEFTVDHTRDPAIFRVRGNVIGGAEAMDFSESVSECIRSGINRAVVDLSGVEVMNSSGLGMLIAANRSFNLAGGGIALAGPSEKVRELLSMTRLDSVFGSYDTESEAAAALSAG